MAEAPKIGVVPGINPLIAFKTQADLEKEKAAAQERARLQEEEKKKREEMLTSLAAYVKRCYEDAENSRNNVITPMLLDNQRQRHGVYDPEVLTEIDKMGGTREYFNITDTIITSLVAWIQDVLLPADGLPFTIEATPIPTLSTDEETDLAKEVAAKYAGVPMQQGLPAQIMDETLALYDLRLKKKQAEADKKAKNMERKIKDQMVEGGFYEAFNEFIDMFATYPNGFFEWQIEIKKRLAWENGTIVAKEEAIPVFHNVDPHDCYPAPNSKTLEDSYFCQIRWFRKSDLSLMREAEGWDKEAIDRILTAEYGYKSSDNLTESGQTERAVLENRDTAYNIGISGGVLRGIEKKGKIQGALLKEYGLEVSDENAFYQAKVILIGNEIVFAELNPDIMGRMHIYTASFEKVPGSLWGKSLCTKLKECQTGYNAANRALIDNLALSSGPQKIVDISLLMPGENPTITQPWGVTQINGENNFNGRKGVEYIDIPNYSEKLINVAETFADRAQDRSLVPKYAQGSADVGGAGQTASGLNQLMTASNKNIKYLIGNMDTYVIRPLVEDLYIYNMMNIDDESIKGDCQIKAKGALAMFIKETTNMRRQEFLMANLNEFGLKTMGLKGIARVQRAIAETLGFNQDIVKTEEEIEEMIQMEEQAAQMQQQMAMQAQMADQQIQMQKAQPKEAVNA